MEAATNDAAAVARGKARVDAYHSRPLIKALNDEDAKAREQLLQEEKKRKKRRGGTPMVTPEAREAASLSAARAYYGMIQ
jgi:hypothetical protein